MASDPNPEDRIEAALDRIAQTLDNRSPDDESPANAVIAQRLDRIIGTLREALGKSGGPN